MNKDVWWCGIDPRRAQKIEENPWRERERGRDIEKRRNRETPGQWTAVTSGVQKRSS